MNTISHPLEGDPRSTFDGRWLPLLVLAGGFVARVIPAWRFFLNPDEALHILLASPASLGVAYKAALTNAHPPLLILVLHYWRWLGQSEWLLRMPSVLAGTACCWLVYLWLKLVTDRGAALIGLGLIAFAPSMIELSSEVRQYALLLFFMSACLYFSERALRENSPGWMVLFSLSLYGALLTHYSSLLFAFTVGVYMLVRLWPYREKIKLFAIWAGGQVVAAAIAVYFLVTHVAHLRGMAQGIAETWLRKSIFHRGERNVIAFVLTQTLRVFTYLFSHGLVGTLALLAFLLGMVALLRMKAAPENDGPGPRQLALLLGLPFVANCAVALAGLYPYGGTRHNAFLALFAISGTGIGLQQCVPTRGGKKFSSVILFFGMVACLALCNFFPAPPPLIRSRNHSRDLMENAVQALRHSAPAGAVVFADYQSGLLLGYYACGHGVVEMFPPFPAFVKSDCGDYTVITARPQEWKFYASDLPGQFAQMAATYGLAAGSKIWLFDAGWITDTAPALAGALKTDGCVPRSFGEDIFFCELTVGGK